MSQTPLQMLGIEHAYQAIGKVLVLENGGHEKALQIVGSTKWKDGVIQLHVAVQRDGENGEGGWLINHVSYLTMEEVISLVGEDELGSYWGEGWYTFYLDSDDMLMPEDYYPKAKLI